MKEALFYTKKPDKNVSCFLCNHCCNIKNGGYGVCSVRLNKEGTLYTLNYDKVVSANIDPIEKKPLYHFLPGTMSYSIACPGCNFKCDFCQNWQISQAKEAEKLNLRGLSLSPERIVSAAKGQGCPSISYTYTEPTIYFELAYETAKLAKGEGLRNVFVTNGYMSKEAIQYISPYLDAANVDLKSFREEFYRKVCKGALSPVLENIKLMRKLNIWVEVTTLLVTGLNDSEAELNDIASFLARVDKDIPWHVSAFHPDYKLIDTSPTPAAVLERAYKIAKSHKINYTYVGNARTGYGQNSYCPSCSKLLIERDGFFAALNDIKEGKCKYCGHGIKGIWL